MSFILEALEEGYDYYHSRADKDIEENRKGRFLVNVYKNGKAVDNAQISYRMKKIDFEFGSNIFMLDQYDTTAENDKYKSLWLNLFNTAVIPFYWEGTEPVRGKLRYSSNNGIDVYRRPPVDAVVEFCRQNELNMKGHPLFWHEFIAEWLPENWEELYPLVEKRFKEISERYADIIPVFDAVNEPSRIWDQTIDFKNSDWKCVYPPAGYIDQVFDLAKKYFPNNTLILNDTVGASFCDFRGIYSGYYQLIEKCIEKKMKIDRIGLQCHTWDDAIFKNVFNAERLYSLLDTYSILGKPLVISEIGIDAPEEIQAKAVEQLYKICFSHKNMSGIFWWNLDDNGVLCDKSRNALGENLPNSGIVHNGKPKEAYKVLDHLINEEWTTVGTDKVVNGKCSFGGFYGIYDITLKYDGMEKDFEVNFCRDSNCEFSVEL